MAKKSKKPVRVTIVDDDLQPGDVISRRRPHPYLVRVLQDPIAGVRSSARGKFLLYAILPVMTVAVILAIAIAASLGLL